jgi:hypothetical protein
MLPDWVGIIDSPFSSVRMAKIQDFSDQIAQQGLRLDATEFMDSGQIISLAKFGPLLGIGLLHNLSLLIIIVHYCSKSEQTY